MSDFPRFAVVGCPDCQGLWILEDRHEHETTDCPQCGSTQKTKQLRALAQADDRDTICELRARVAAQRAGHHEEYDREDDYAVLEEQATDYLSRHDEVLEADVEQAIERSNRIQRETYAPAAAKVLDRDEKFENAAEIYLDRRERELEQLVAIGGPSTEERSDAAPTPFSERSEPANLSLTTPETLLEHVDVRMRDPPIAPTDVWQQLWQDSAMHTRFRDALDTLSGADYRSAWATLTDNWGVMALGGETAGYASYVIDTLQQPSMDRWYDVIQLTRQLGGSTVLGQSDRSDIINGPIALLAGSEVTPSIAIHLTHDFFDEYKRIQRVRLLDFLQEVSKGTDVQIVCHGSIAPKKLLQFHEADLPSSAVTEAPQAYHFTADQPSHSIQSVAADALEDLGLDHPTLSVLERLAEEGNERLEYSALRADDAFEVTEAAVGKRVRTLIEHRLISKDKFNTTNHIQLLPAGTAFLKFHDREKEAQHVQSVLDGFADGDTADSDAEDAGSDDLTNPPNSSHRTVYASASTGGGDEEETTPAAGSTVDVAPVEDDIVASGEWLSTAQQTAVSSAVSGDIDVALADEPAPHRDHCGNYHVGFNEEEKEIVVSLQPSPCAARTVTRLCAALLDPRLQNTLLTAERLNGADGEDLGTLLEDAVNPTVLRGARQLGWLPDRAASGEDYPDQLVSALADLLEDVEKIGSDDDFDADLARSVCRRGHGLAGTITHIYELLGWDVTRELTFPEYSRHFHEDHPIHLKTLATQIAITSQYGHYPMYRTLYEDREDKRNGSLGAPNVDDIDPSGDIIGSWVLRGPGIDRLAADLAHLERFADLEIQEDGGNFAAFYSELTVSQATRQESIEEAVERLCWMKLLKPTRSATALLSALTGSVYSTAEALSGLAAAREFERDITLDEVRYALSTLDPDQILPTLNRDEDGTYRNSARSKFVHTLLTATEPLSTSEIADRAGITTQSIRNHRDDLAALGLLEITEQGAGKATLYRLRLPFPEDRYEQDAPRPLYLPDGEGEDGHSMVRYVVYHLLEARGLGDAADAAPAIDEGLMGWPPDLRPAVERWPWLRPWINTIDWLFGQEGGGSLCGPGKWIDGPYELTCRFGTEPATTQGQLPTQEASG